MSSKLLLFLITILLICFPFLYYFILWFSYDSWFFLESSVFSINYRDFLVYFWENKSIFLSGNDSIYLLNYVPSYSYFYFFEYLVGNKISWYFLSIIVLLILSIWSFLWSMNTLIKAILHEKKKQISFWVLVIVSILFYTCLSNFLFFPSTIYFFLPIILFPVQLFLILYAYERKKIYPYIVLIFISFLITTNITLIVINNIFLLFFSSLFLSLRNIHGKEKIQKLITLCLSLLPSFVFVAIPVVINNLYLDSSLDSTIELIREDFYSVNSSIYTIITQTGFWWLFWSFNGELYYDFSEVYSQKIFHILSLIPYIMILFFFLSKENTGTIKKYSLTFIACIVIIICIMLGLHNPVYSYLYNHFTLFQIFRNITKFAPFLQLIVCILLLILIEKEQTKSHIKKWFIYGGLWLSLLYNIPYISYTHYFFENRLIPSIPTEHIETATYIKNISNHHDKILLLPIVYNLESYSWNDKKYDLQGNMYDSLLLWWKAKAYRFWELWIGPVILQKDFKKLLVDSTKTSRKLELDYSHFEDFLKNHHFNKIVITSDIISEYQKILTIEENIKKYNFKEVFSNKTVKIYENDALKQELIQIVAEKQVQKINPRYYTLSLKGIKGKLPVEFSWYFHNWWNLYLEKNNIPQKEMSFDWKKTEFQDSHTRKSWLFNAWMIDTDFIKNNYSSEYFRENEDGSIDIHLSLYFLPQLSLIKSLYFLLFVLIWSILWVWVLSRSKK